MRSKYLGGLVCSQFLLFLVVVLCSLCSSSASAQTFFGSIVGTVTDPSGAAVAGATVEITDLSTNEKRTASTDSSGTYRFVNLVPASYRVEVSAPGFKSFVRSSVAVQVDNTARVDATMQVGAVTETVEVSAAPPMLQTDSATLGDTVEAKQLQGISLNGRNAMNLMELVPGIVPQGASLGSAAMNGGSNTGSVGWGNYQIGGGMPTQGAIFIDGAPTMVMQKDTAALVPTQDTIQEFRVETSGVSAEFGRFGGGVVSMTTRSGTNAFHGTAYEYIRNRDVNANLFFDKRNGLPRPEWTQNQYGVTVGGPIWKNKAFFFAGYEGIHIREAALAQTNIPSPAMQQGIIPEVYNSSGKLVNNVTDPRGNCKITHQAGTPAAPGTWTITNLWQGACGDPTAKILATFYPNQPKNSAGVYNYVSQYSQGDDGYQVSGRVDFDVTKNQRIFGRFTIWPLNDESPNILGNANGWQTSGDASHNRATQIVTGDTYTFNPTTVLDVRADYLRQYGDSIPPVYGNVNEAQFGAPFATLAPLMTFKNLPSFSFAGTGQVHNLFNFTYAGVDRMTYNNYHLSASLTKILGNHTLKIGGEARLMQRDDIGNDPAPSGSFTYGADFFGDEWSAFLMGYFDSDTITTYKSTTTYTWYSGYYLEDTWQAARNLTLNLGVRFDFPGGIKEAHDNLLVLLPKTTDPVTGIAGTAGLVSSNLWSNRADLLAPSITVGPRVGFAYRLTDSTVFRGGYSLSYITFDGQTGAFAVNQPINQASTSYSNAVGVVNYTMGVNPFPQTNQYPNGYIAEAAGRSNPNFMVGNIGQTVTGPYPYEPYPASQGMNVSFGHQFRGDTLIDIGVAHTLGTHLPNLSAGLDQLPDQYDSMGTALSAALTGGNRLSYDGVTLPSSLQLYGQTLRPYPAYKNYSNSAAYHGTSSYNALEIKVQKRFHSAGQIGGAYTWMKMIGDTDTLLSTQEVKSGGAGGNGEGLYQDYDNPRGERSIYSFDVPNRLVINYVLNLPFGKGQRFGAQAQGLTERAISGWSLNGITTLQSGYPLYLTTSGNKLSTNFGAGTIRPNYTPGCTKTVGGSGYTRSLPGAVWFNTSCFTLPNTPGVSGPGTSASYGFGDEPRTDEAVKSAGVDNFDLAAVKSTPIHEQVALELRVEFYNVFNRVQFAPPVTQVDNVQFGQVINQANQPRLIQGALRLNF